MFYIDDLCRLICIEIKKIKINNLTINSGGGIKNKISLTQLTELCKKVSGHEVKK